VTVASPCPSAADVITIHAACDAALHAHSLATTTERLPEPPAAANDAGAPVTVAWQRLVDGLVTLVEVELPQAAAEVSAASAMANGRDPGRQITALRNAGKSPSQRDERTLRAAAAENPVVHHTTV
jgi:hypothetical protein